MGTNNRNLSLMQSESNRKSLLVAREGIPLGVLSETEVRELLAAGFLHPTDLYRRPEDPDWKRLIKLEHEAKRRFGVQRFIKKHSGCLFPITEEIASKSRALSAKLKSFVMSKKTVLTEGSQRVPKDYLPQIRKRATEQLVARPASTVRSALPDDRLMRNIFGAVYDCLPKPVYRFVPEVVFIEFCLQNKTRLLPSHDKPLGPTAPSSEPDKLVE